MYPAARILCRGSPLASLLEAPRAGPSQGNTACRQVLNSRHHIFPFPSDNQSTLAHLCGQDASSSWKTDLFTTNSLFLHKRSVYTVSRKMREWKLRSWPPPLIVWSWVKWEITSQAGVGVWRQLMLCLWRETHFDPQTPDFPTNF